MIRLTVFLCLLCSLIGACTDGGHEDPSAAPQTDIIAESEASIIRVETISAEETILAEPLIASGTVAAKQTSNIGALAEGVVERIFVRVGDRVQKGAPLFRTRQIDYQRRLIEAEAMRDVAQAEVARANTLVDRYTPLAPDGVVSGVVFDDAKTALPESQPFNDFASGKARNLGDYIINSGFKARGGFLGDVVVAGALISSSL